MFGKTGYEFVTINIGTWYLNGEIIRHLHVHVHVISLLYTCKRMEEE